MDSQIFAETFHMLRNQSGLTQREIADRLNVTPNAVSKWERGLSFPDISLLPKISIILDMDIESLLRGSVRYTAESWEGILIADDCGIDDVSLTSIVYDKPLIHYLIGYFLLAGISDIKVVCNTEKYASIEKSIAEINDLGFAINFSNSLDKTLNIDKNIMLLTGKYFIYGADLTRHFQRAMAENQDVTVCLSGARCTKIYDDIETCSPIIFIDNKYADKLADNGHYNALLKDCFDNGKIQTEFFPRGMIIRNIVDTDERDSAAEFVEGMKLYQNEDIGNISEIANNRGLIEKDRDNQ